MKKTYLLIAAGLLCTASMQAQKKVIATLGFEDGDATFQTEYPLTPLKTPEDFGYVNSEDYSFGDWVNFQDGDQWDEKCTDDPHSGEYCFMAANQGKMANTWDRGFKMGLPMKPNTPYRVSFWAKIDPTCTYIKTTDGNDVEVTENTQLTSWLSKGVEELDQSIPGYGMDKVSGFNGAWQHFSYVVYTPTPETIDATHSGKESWQGTKSFPTQYGGTGESYWNHFGQKFPDLYFFIANMFCPATYYLDDIVIEEGVTVKEVTYNLEAIRVDFGYATNMAQLANAAGGTVVLSPSLVSVTRNGNPVTVDYLEGKSDGYLYIYPNIDEDGELTEDDELVVSFVSEPTLLYASDKRPSDDTTGDVAVFGFTEEKAYYVGNDVDEGGFDVPALAWGAPVMVSSVPVNNSFNLKSEDVKELTVTYSSKVDITSASAILKHGSKSTSFTKAMTLTNAGKTIVIPVSDLEDGNYTLEISGLKNALGVLSNEKTELKFEIGVSGSGVVDVAYSTKDVFTQYGANTIPLGWSGRNSEENSYRDGHGNGNAGGGAPRLQGGNNDPSHGIYFSQRAGSDTYEEDGVKITYPGLMAFGKYAVENLVDGQLAEGYTEEEALHLNAGTYILDFKMARWENKADGTYTFKVCNAEGETVLSSGDTPIKPESGVSGASDPQTNPVKASSYEFAVEEDGYYYIEFTTKTGFQDLILLSLSVTSKPESNAAMYNQKLDKAIEDAAKTMELADDEKYDGASKSAFIASMEKALSTTFTTPDEVEAMISELSGNAAKVVARINSFNDFETNILSTQEKFETIEEKYKESDIIKEAQKVLEQYAATDPKTLSDADLAAAANAVKNLPSQIDAVKNAASILTAQAQKAAALALLLNVNGDAVDKLDNLVTDNANAINGVNSLSTIELCKLIAGGDDLSDIKNYYYDMSTVNPEYEDGDEGYDDSGHPLLFSGVDFTAYVRNPNFYTTVAKQALADDVFTGWKCDNRSTGEQAAQNEGADASNPVRDTRFNGYGDNVDYVLYQTIDNLPAGVYAVNIDTRTASYTWDYDEDGTAESNEYNGFDDETGLWDKYMFVRVDDEVPENMFETVTVADEEKMQTHKFSVGGWGQLVNTRIANVTVKEGQKLTFGVVEHYTSGKAMKNGEVRTFWDTTTYVDNAALYFTAPLSGYDYAAAAADMTTGVDTQSVVSGAKSGVRYNLAGQKVTEAYQGIVIRDGRKILQK